MLVNNKQITEDLGEKWLKSKNGEINFPTHLYCPTRDIFQSRLDRMIRIFSESKKMSESLAYTLAAIAGEIGNNSFDHNLGNWPDVPGIFFSYETEGGAIKIILADRGQGVLKTLQRVKPELKTDAEALKAAFTERISGRAPENRGNGLKFVKENIEDKKMHLTFISGSAKAELNDKMEITRLSENSRGCLAILTL